MRNPWGKDLGTWNGKWSDNDNESWSNGDIGVKPTMEDDGFSWICLEDFMTHFSFTNICKYNDDDLSTHAYMQEKNADKQSYFYLNIDKPENLDFLVN